MFDFSGYPKDSVYYAGLKSKMYSLSIYDGWELNKAKGINLKPRHQEYVDVLFGKKVARHKIKRIQSKSLSCFDDKRYILDDGINNLVYGHKDIVKQNT